MKFLEQKSGKRETGWFLMLLVIAAVVYLFKVDQSSATEIVKNAVTPVLAFLGTVLGIHEYKGVKKAQIDAAQDDDTHVPPSDLDAIE